MEFLKNVWNWLSSRVTERTTWDGLLMGVFALAVLVPGPWDKFVPVAAVAIVGWSAYTILRKQRKSDDL